MNAVFLAINGDDVGSSIGNAIASDNHEELARVSGSVKDSHGKIEEWVKSVGGRVVTSSGDEGIYQVPAETVGQLEQIRADYAMTSGHTLTIGVGNSMSEASKALIYGKYSDKDQIVHYEPAIEDYISQEGEAEPQVPGAEDVQEQADMAQEHEVGVEGDAGLEGEVPNKDDIAVDEAGLAGEEVPAPEAEMAPEAGMGGQEMAPEGAVAEADEEGNAGIDAKSVGEEDPKDMVQGIVGDENAEQGIDGDIDGAAPESMDMEGQVEGEAAEGEGIDDEDAHNQYLTDMVSGHMEGGEEGPEAGMEDPMAAQQDPMAEQGMEGQMGEEAPQELGQEDIVGAEEEVMPEGEPEEGGGDEELKSDITQALMVFKQNKGMLEELQGSNPELYTGTITMLRAMIEMSKRLGFAPQGMEGDEGDEGIPEEGMPEEGMEDDEGIPEEGIEAPAEEGAEEESASMPGAEDEDEDEEEIKGKFGKK